MKKPVIKWLPDVEPHDYLAAACYLALLTSSRSEVEQIIDNLKEAPISHFKAKDLYRASQLSLLGVSNSHVAKDQKKIRKGKKLSPLLLVHSLGSSDKLQVADGYHRLCAVYSFNEDALIPCKIV